VKALGTKKRVQKVEMEITNLRIERGFDSLFLCYMQSA